MGTMMLTRKRTRKTKEKRKRRTRIKMMMTQRMARKNQSDVVVVAVCVEKTTAPRTKSERRRIPIVTPRDLAEIFTSKVFLRSFTGPR
ncbi:Hypothetical protein GL50581_3031 [Giardia duodenalis ATCC 50581]|uniref:Uncharacterized protein n=1 Tax=Giardia intestinalis (strain ATCC 50581 / GS clone H7) TaxID=598745 RepID=C6LW73_GIAIB|nr:Hypothetical protein GL50581_3031 [Giardia intestinalis ATCC 50581]